MPADVFAFGGAENLTAIEFVQTLLGRAVSRVNAGVSHTLTARQTSERPPKDSRHLTDTRTRVSQLLEYSVAYEMNHILNEEQHGYSISAVLWNVFPDLIVRDEYRSNILGLEVKALHTAAEEKSANLDVPIQIIRRGKDFVVILIWAWTTNVVNGTSITYPHIHAAEVFDAWILAKIRDFRWLLNQEGRVKGIDLCTPIISASGGRFKAEEGNLGKLMRIDFPNDMPNSVPGYADLRAEGERYQRFVQLILALGLRESFVDICTLDGAIGVEADPPHDYPATCKKLGHATRRDGASLILLAGGRSAQQWLRQSLTDAHPNGSTCIWLSQKLSWKVYKREVGDWRMTGEGQKPDSQVEEILAALGTV